MSRSLGVEFDWVGYWSEVKLDIIKEYASAYSKILSANKFYHVYIDAFAGPGTGFSKTTGELILGSPLKALLEVGPLFREYHFIDIDEDKAALLEQVVGTIENVHVHPGDCNSILLDKVFPSVRYEDYRRGLCVLDPYGLHLNWEIIRTAGQMRSIEIFLNFPVMDMNRKVIWHDPEGVHPSDIARMNAFWGDDSWREIAYTKSQGLFGWFLEKQPNEVIAEAFRRRLIEVAGFKEVPEPMPMRNSNRAIVYYLFFASQRSVASDIVRKIFKKYRERV